MEDAEILALYENRSEEAIRETEKKYGAYCFSVAMNVLEDRQDAQEVISDTWLSAWNSIPPQKPRIFSSYLAKITRNLAIDRWRGSRASKRGGGQMALALEELSGCIPGGESPEKGVLRQELLEGVVRFLATLPPVERNVFLCRYWYFDSAQDIGARLGLSGGRVRSMLCKTRKKLRAFLEEEKLI